MERPKFIPATKTYTIKDELKQLMRAYYDWTKRIGIYKSEPKQ